MAAAGNAKLSVTMSIVDKATAPLREIKQSIKGAFEPVRAIKNQAKLTAANLGLPKIKVGFTNVKNAAGGFVKELKGVGKELAILGGLGAGLFSGMIYSTANAADAAYKTAQKVGVTTESWSKLAHAADMSGVSSEEMRTGLGKLNGQVMKCAMGNKEAQYWFRELGVSVRDQSGKLRSADAVFADVAEKISGIENETVKAGFAAKIFGEDLGPKLVPLLNAGKDGLAAYGEEAERLNMVFTDDQGKAAESFNDSMARMKKSIKGVGFSIGNSLLPELEPLFKEIESFFTDNRESIAGTVKEWVGGIRSLVGWLGGWGKVLPMVAGGLTLLKLSPLIMATLSLGKAILGLGGAFAMSGGKFILLTKLHRRFLDVIRFSAKVLYGFGGAFKAVLMPLSKGLLGFGKGALIVGKALGGMLVKGVFAAAVALKAFFATLLMSPITWIVVGIAGAAYLIYRNWEPISKWFIGIWKDIKVAVGAAWGWICAKVSAAASAISSTLSQAWTAIVGTIKAIFAPIVAYFEERIQAVRDAFQVGFLDGVAAIFRNFNPLLWIMDALDAVTDYLFDFKLTDAGASVISSLWDGLKSMWENVVSWISDIPKSIGNLIPESLLKTIDAVKDITSGIGGAVSGIVGGVKDTVADVAGSAWNGISSAVGSIGNVFGGSVEQPVEEEQYGPPIGVQEMMRKEFVHRQESVREARVFVDFANVPEGVAVKAERGVQTRVRKAEPAYIGARMGY